MRAVLAAAFVVSMMSVTVAQNLEVGLDGGYGFGYGAAFMGDNIERDSTGNNLKYEQVYASGGTGLKISGEIAYFFTENVGIMAASGYSRKNSYSTELKDPWGSISRKGATSYLPITIGLKFRAKMKIVGINVVPYVYFAPGIYLPKKTETYATPTDTTESIYTYGNGGFGVSSGIGAVIKLPMLSNRVGIKLEFSPTYASANPTKIQVKEKHAVAPPTDVTYTYKNNTIPKSDGSLPLGVAIDQPHDSYCSMTVRAGINVDIF
jgi:hypothetical protein